jgi:hypothetical protein
VLEDLARTAFIVSSFGLFVMGLFAGLLTTPSEQTFTMLAYGWAVATQDGIVADRNFCTLGFLFGLAQRGAFFVMRPHASNVVGQPQDPRRGVGHDAKGQVRYEQTLCLTEPNTGATLAVRRITVQRHTPTRDGDTERHILTNLPVAAAPAALSSALYAARGTSETAFQHLTVDLAWEGDT